MGVVQPSQGKLAPASEHLRSEVWIVTELARSVLGEDWSAYAADYDRIRDRIAQVVPGHEQYIYRGDLRGLESQFGAFAFCRGTSVGYFFLNRQTLQCSEVTGETSKVSKPPTEMWNNGVYGLSWNSPVAFHLRGVDRQAVPPRPAALRLCTPRLPKPFSASSLSRDT